MKNPSIISNIDSAILYQDIIGVRHLVKPSKWKEITSWAKRLQASILVFKGKAGAVRWETSSHLASTVGIHKCPYRNDECPKCYPKKTHSVDQNGYCNMGCC